MTMFDSLLPMAPIAGHDRFRLLRAAVVSRLRANRPDLVPRNRNERPVGVTILVAGIDVDGSDVATGLATATAQTGESTLLVRLGRVLPPVADADRSMSPGDLEIWLRQGGSNRSIVETVRPHLDVVRVASGISPDDEREACRWDELLVASASVYRWTIIAPRSLNDSADAVELASVVDGVVLTVVPGRTRGNVANAAKDTMIAAGGDLLGVVLADGPRRS